MPTIYIPERVSKPTRCANHIEEVGNEIEKTINQTVQNTLNSLERDCDHIAELVRSSERGFGCCVFALFLLILLFVHDGI